MGRMFFATISCILVVITSPCPTPACTSFCMDTPDGPIYGTNLDLFFPGDGLVLVNRREIAKEGYLEGIDGEVARWVSTYGSVTFNLAGRELVWGGMNEAGLAMSPMELKAAECPKPDERPPVGEGYLIQYVLDTSSTVEEAVRVISGVRPVEKECFSHFLIVDNQGNVAAIEYLDGELVIHIDESAPLKAMANMPYQRACDAYARGGPRWWWSNPGGSAQRVAGAVDRARNYDSRQDTCAVTYAFETLTQVVAAPHTKWNVVFDLTKKKIWYRSLRSPAVKTIELQSLDFYCDAPELMLDVNAELVGDVGPLFWPYDHEVNLEVFQAFCYRWGIEVSQEGTENLMDLFESFECAAE